MARFDSYILLRRELKPYKSTKVSTLDFIVALGIVAIATAVLTATVLCFLPPPQKAPPPSGYNGPRHPKEVLKELTK